MGLAAYAPVTVLALHTSAHFEPSAASVRGYRHGARFRQISGAPPGRRQGACLGSSAWVLFQTARCCLMVASFSSSIPPAATILPRSMM